MKPLVLVLGAAAVSAAAVGCGPNCEPEPDITVSLSPESEEVRALPVLASGKLQLLDTDVWDSHGQVVVGVHPKGVDNVVLDSVSFEQQIGGQTKNIERVRTLLNDVDFTDASEASEGTKLGFFWRMKQLAEFGLEEAAAHTSKVTVNWRYAGCRTQSGTATLDLSGKVKGVSTPKNFVLQTAESGRLETANGPMAKMVLKSAWSNDVVQAIANPSYTVVFFSEGLPPIIGLGLADKSKIALRVNGMPRRSISSTEQLEVFTSSDASAKAPYDHAGTAAATQALIGGGKAVVQLKIESERANSAAGAQQDVITALVDVP